MFFFFALTLSTAQAASTPPLAAQLEHDLNRARGSQFDALISTWNRRYGEKAVDALKDLAQRKSLDEKKRFVATLGLARVGGPASDTVASTLHGLLKDKQWLVRMAALRAIAMNQMKGSATHVFESLKDPALVVRSEAISTLETLKPEGSVEALLGAIKDPTNYHKGKAQWVPNYALATLIKLKAPKSVAIQLKDLLDRESDPKLQLGAVEAIEALHGDRSQTKKELKLRVAYWKQILSK